MNPYETSAKNKAEIVAVDLDGLRLERTDQEFLPGVKAFEHQIESARLIEASESLFLFNHSPTGSGKTISWLKPALDRKMKVIAIYPTNALVIDQKSQVENFIKRNNRLYNSQDYHIQAITSDLLAEERKLYPDETGLRKGQLLNRIIRKGRGRGLILLTNPDILMLALKDAYYEHNIREAVRSVDMIVVDEFHLASVKQSDMLLFMMHEISDDQRSRLKKFVFLSATPNDQIVKRAVKAGLNVIVFDDKSTPLSCSKGHPILPKLKLNFRSGAIYRTYELIKGDLEYFIDFCQRPISDGNSAKAVFILDGIYEVDEIYKVLTDALRDKNLKVERVDGLHPATPEKLARFDVLVSNSSVEVGIDFKVDRLVFSGYSKSKFLQRIGRLRQKAENETCEAICFVPNVLFDHFKELSAKANTQSLKLTRKELAEHLTKLMESGLDLSSYSKMYSPMEAFLYLKSRIKGGTWRDYLGEEHHEKGMPASIQGAEWLRTLTILEKHFLDTEIDGQMYEWLEEESDKLKEGLLSYRGSRFQALMFDTTDDQLKLYDLMYLLRRGKVEFMPSQRFALRLRESYGEKYNAEIKPRYESMKRFAAGFCWYRGTLDDETRKVLFKGEGAHYKKIMLNAADHVRKPRMVDGFKVETDPNIPSLSYLNDTMTEYQIFARLIDQSGFYLKAKFNLGDFFYLYPYSGMRSVAFGHDALYIDCLIKEEYERRR